jgi:hypothetical protein
MANPSVQHLQQSLHCFCWKTIKIFVLPIVSSPKLLSKSLMVAQHFPQFKMKSDADTLFFQACHFTSTLKLQMEQHALVLNKTLLNNHTRYGLIQSRK